MKLLLILIIVIQARKPESQLQKQNLQLKSANSILHKQILQLSKISNLTSLIQDDFLYNKQKLFQILNEFYSQPDPAIKTNIAQQILEFTQAIYQDLNLLGGSRQGVSSERLLKTFKYLQNSLQIAKDHQANTQFALIYNDLQQAFNRKQSLVQALQSQNAQLYAQLTSKQAQLKDLQSKSLADLHKLKTLQQEISINQKDYQTRVQNIKQVLSTQQQNIRNKESASFKTIQDSQDSLILGLQSKVAQYSFEIEQLSLTKVSLESKVVILQNSVDRLKSELAARSNQLREAQLKFEEFRTDVNKEIKSERSSTFDTETSFRTEMKSVQEKESLIKEELMECKKESQILKTSIENKQFRINNLVTELGDSEKRLKLAQKARDQQINILQDTVRDFDDIQSELNQKLQEKKINKKIPQTNSPIFKNYINF